MHSQSATDPELIELERKARELSRSMFALCEKRLSSTIGKPSAEHLALAATAMTLQKALAAFLAVEKLCG